MIDELLLTGLNNLHEYSELINLISQPPSGRVHYF